MFATVPNYAREWMLIPAMEEAGIITLGYTEKSLLFRQAYQIALSMGFKNKGIGTKIGV